MDNFTFVPLGPRNDEDGRWCCGLYCGKPCPYELKIKPKGIPREAEQQTGNCVSGDCNCPDRVRTGGAERT